LVEDEALVAMLAEDFLTGFGFDAIVVASAMEAMRALQSDAAPVLAVIDVGLPDERGDSLALRMRALRPELKIIVASGYDEADLRARFDGDAFVAILAKPYTEGDLARTARDLGFAVEAG
jgi:CheY-like chemotaxis protein